MSCVAPYLDLTAAQGAQRFGALTAYPNCRGGGSADNRRMPGLASSSPILVCKHRHPELFADRRTQDQFQDQLVGERAEFHDQH